MIITTNICERHSNFSFDGSSTGNDCFASDIATLGRCWQRHRWHRYTEAFANRTKLKWCSAPDHSCCWSEGWKAQENDSKNQHTFRWTLTRLATLSKLLSTNVIPSSIVEIIAQRIVVMMILRFSDLNALISLSFTVYSREVCGPYSSVFVLLSIQTKFEVWRSYLKFEVQQGFTFQYRSAGPSLSRLEVHCALPTWLDLVIPKSLFDYSVCIVVC